MNDETKGMKDDGPHDNGDAQTVPFDPLDDENLLSTDEIDAIAKKKSEDEPGRLEQLWHRVDHVYHTKVRTTTAILIIAFFGCVIGYGYVADYYGVAPNTVNEQQQQQQRQAPPPTSEVRESVPSERPSESVPREETDSESESTPSPTSTSTTGPFDFFNPDNQTGTPSPSPDSDSAPTQSVPAR